MNEKIVNAGVSKQLALIGLFFISGALGLVYEIVWARQLSLFLGVSVYAISAVLVAFMAGLGIGSEFFGRLLDKGFSPVRLYASLEIGLGVYLLLFPVILSILQSLYVTLHVSEGGATPEIILLRAGMAVAAMIIPTALMGGTLPAMVRFFAMNREIAGGKVAGWLYAVNTLGAMVGCITAGFVMIELFGLSTTLMIGGGLNILLGVVAWLVGAEPAFQVASEKSVPAKKVKIKDQPRPDMTLLFLYGLSGFCALSLELLWTRTLILLLNNTTYAFTLILAVFLLGIGFGSAVAMKFVGKTRDSNRVLFSLFQTGVGILALFSLFGFALNETLIGILDSVMRESGFLAAIIPGGEPMAQAVMFSLLTVGPCAFLMGCCFPPIAAGFSEGVKRAGGEIGRVYAVNIIGSVTGSILAGFILIPLIGVHKGVILIAWIALVSGLYALLTSSFKARTPLAVMTLIVALPVSALLLLNTDVVYYLSTQKLDAGSDVEFYMEGPSATVLVSSQESDLTPGRRPFKRLWINGDPIAGSFREALQLERLQAHIPLLLHPDPKNALVICFGTGSTAGAVKTHRIENVTAVDISREVFMAANFFQAGNLEVANSEKLTIIEEDGRNYLLTTRRFFDFITSEPPPPSNAGIVSLYTKEYYELMARRLKKGGIVSQWIPLHHLSEADFKSLVASFVEVFPNTSMWLTKWDAIMIGSLEETPVSLDTIQERMEFPEVAKSLGELGIRNAYQLFASYMMGRDQLKEYVKGIEPLIDDKPTVEFSAPRVGVGGVSVKGGNLAGIIEFREPPPSFYFTEEQQERFKSYFDSQTSFLDGRIAMNDNKMALAAGAFNKALAKNPDNPDARYALLSLNLSTIYKALSADKIDLGLAMLGDTEKLDDDKLFEPQYHFLRAMFYARMGKTDEAETQFKSAIKLDKNYFLAVVNLAGLYDTKLDEPVRAKELYGNALKMKSTPEERVLVLRAYRDVEKRLKTEMPGLGNS